ncbi:MAG TPA: hypothetical protein VG984_02245 [Candidatus Paceibacterota bacterium]|nr:hypothetical protein [Candidatus Paceibacterota bacterium]
MTSRLRARRRRRAYIIAGLIALVVVLLAVLAWAFVSAPFARITKVTVSGSNVVPASSIEDAVQHELKGKYAFIFPKDSIFLYSRHTIEDAVLSLYPTLKTVGVHAKDFHTLSVVVTERTPKALWCGTDASSAANTCMFLDENALAYAYAPQYSDTAYTTYYGALKPGTASSSKQFLTSDQFHSLSALARTFEQHVAPDRLSYVSVNADDDATLQFAPGYSIRFSLHDDGGDIYNHFTVAQKAASFANHPLSDFDYIDLRFGDKVYYKLKNE